MALNDCADCSTSFAAGLLRCPHCGSADFTEQGQAMPKITAQGGPSNARAEIVGADWDGQAWESGDSPAPPPAPESAYPPDAVPLDETPEEEPSPGSSSETSPEKPSTVPGKKPPVRPSRARKTANRSPRGRTGGSSAPSTAGGPTADTSEPDTKTGE